MTVNDFINTLISFGWKVELKSQQSFQSNVLQDRYGSIPDSYKEFLEIVASCINPENDTWFLCEADFEGTSDSAFVWNEFELLSLESALDDESLIVPIKDFWNNHLPILISVKNCYEFLAISLKENEKGFVVQGNEPEFEEVVKVSYSFDELMEKIIQIQGTKKTFSLLDLL